MSKYKHELYLIERTKLLEGIYCQSITFTNSKGNVYTNNPKSALSQIELVSKISTSSGGMVDNGVTDEATQAIKEFFNGLYKNPLQNNTPLKILSCEDVYDELKNTTADILYADNLSATEDALTVTADGKTNVYDEKTSLTIGGFNRLLLVYKIIWQVISLGRTYYYEFTVNYTISGIENRYPLKPYTITDCINRCLELAEPICQGQAPRYRLQGVSYDENGNIVKPYATGSLAEKYDKITAPEFTMTQCNLREQLKVIGGYVHAEPRLNENDEIVFDEYGIGEKAKIADKPYVYKGIEQGINEYCTKIETSASNIVNALNYAQGVIFDPNENHYRTLRTDSVNVLLSESNAKVQTSFPIHDIISVKCGLYNTDGTWQIEPVDITPYVFEQHEYFSNLSSYEGTYPYSKCYAIYYTQDSKNIDGLFFKAENAMHERFSYYAIANILSEVTGIEVNTFFNPFDEDVSGLLAKDFPLLAFQVTYIPVYDTKFAHSKQYIIPGRKPYAKIYNQSENLIETRYYGENIKGVVQRLGNVEESRTYILNDVADIPKVGQTVDEYAISAVNTEYMPNHIKCTVALTKDFNRISQYIGINSNKRVYEVSEREAYKRNILLHNYVVIEEANDNDVTNDPDLIFNSINSVYQVLDPRYVSTDKPINAVNAMSTSKTDTEFTKPFGDVILPVISSAFGNTMVFSWTYKDNYSAGEMIYSTDDEIEADTYWQTDVPYCDYYGRAYWHRFLLLSDVSVDDATSDGLEQALTVANLTLQSSKYHCRALKLRKDSRETLSFNFEVEFVTTREDIVIGSALASLNPLVSGTPKYSEPLWVYFFKDPIGKFDKTVSANNRLIHKHLPSLTLSGNKVKLSFTVPDIEFKSWAIVTPDTEDAEPTIYEDEDGNVESIKRSYGGDIILSSNRDNTYYAQNGMTEAIQFVPKRTIYDR